MAEDLSLLFRLKADNAQVKSVFADTQAGAVNTAAQLREAFGPQIAQTISSTSAVFTDALGDIGGAVQSLVSSQLEQLPAAGSLMGQFGSQTKSASEKADLAINLVSNSVSTLSTVTKSHIPRIKQSLGPELAQAVTVSSTALSGLTTNLANFVGQQIPIAGGVITRLAGLLRGFGAENKTTGKAIATVADSITKISQQSGKSVPQIAQFLTRFVLLENQSKRNEAAFQFFGGSVDLIGNKTARFIPELEEAGTALASVSAKSAAAGGSIAAMAGPIGLAVIAIAALAAGVALATRELIQVTISTAAFQGKMHDLAQEVNLTVSTLSAFEVLSKRTGGELGSITQAIVLFQRKLDDAQNPLSKTAELFRKFNITTSDTETSLRSAFAALAAMPAGFAQTNAAAELFGARGGKQVLAILKETNGDIDGTIARLREMGILISEDAARAADKLNDELATFEFQLRALTAAVGEDFIPVLTDVVRSLGLIVRAIQPIIAISASLLSKALFPVTKAFQGLAIVVAALTGDYKALAEAMREANDVPEIKPVPVPEVAPVPLPSAPTPQQAASEAVNQSDAVLAAVKRKAAEQSQALDELFQRGRRDRDQQALETITANKKILDAETDRIDKLLAQKEIEIKALDEAQVRRGEIIRRDTDDYRAITAEIVKLQQERLDKENEFAVTSRAIRAKAAKENADSQRNQIANDTDLLVTGYDQKIKETEAAITRGAQAESDGLKLIELFEQAKIDARIQSVKDQKAVGFLTVQNQKDLDNELVKLGQERDRLLDEQRDRRLQRERSAVEREREILISNIDALLQVAQIRGQRLIDAQASLAEARVITEEQAAKRILEINLGLIDAQIEATKTKLTAARSIVDVSERVRTEADLNNQIKILTEERVSIEAAGEREIDAGRKRDLQNYRDYVDELRDLTQEVTRIQREAAEEAIRLLRINFAPRRDIIRAQLKLDIDEENERHRLAEQHLRDLERENRESRRSELEKLDIEFEINRRREAEAERHRLAMEGIKTRGEKEKILAGPFGGLDIGLATGQLAELENGVQSFADVARVAFSAVGAAVNQLAQGVGGLVQQWVLLGSNGPNAMRKLVASVLAGVAAQAATLAVMELAYGIAALTPWGAAVYGPAAFHFKSAALFGSIAAIAGTAGRGVAGGIFQQGSGAGASAGTNTGPQELNPLTLQRNSNLQPQPQRVIVEVVVKDSEFGRAITSHVVKDVHSAGPIREALAGDGNLSR